MEKNNIDNALKSLVLNTLLDMEDINDVTCYEFKMCLNAGKVFRLKGVVKVEFEEVE